MIDADTETVDERKLQLERALEDAGENPKATLRTDCKADTEEECGDLDTLSKLCENR